MSEYFLGRKEVACINTQHDHGNAAINCTIHEYWSPIISDSCKCGSTKTHVIKNKIGVDKKIIDALEGTLATKIGISSIANLQAEIKNNITSETHWEVVREEERTEVFPSPKCGEYMIIYYQKMRDYHLICQSKRWYARNTWQYHFTESTQFYHNGSKIIDNHPDCNCKETAKNFDGTLYIDFGTTSMIAPYKITENKLDIDFLGKIYTASSDQPITMAETSSFLIEIPSELIPDTLKFLGNMYEASCQATIIPYHETNIADGFKSLKSEPEKPSSFEEGGIDAEIEISITT